VAAVQLTDLHVLDRRRPDKAIDALDEACAHTQATATYPPRAEKLMQDRVRKMREAAPPPPRPGDPERRRRESQPGDDGWDNMTDRGLDALERFGAGLESIFASPQAPQPPGKAAKPEAAAPPAVIEPEVTLGELDTELSRVLAEEGIVVRAHDVARVVSFMAGKPVAWTPGESA
jgi:ATP-dependent Clp protease ATP-binding subunit ClpA